MHLVLREHCWSLAGCQAVFNRNTVFFGKVLECLDLIQVTRQVLQAKDMRAKEFTYLQDPLSISVSSEI